MNAIVLVGGEGTRLRPLTWRTPKALVPVLNRPLLDRLLLHLRQHGVTSVTLAMTQRSHVIEHTYGDGSQLNLEVSYAYEETPLGSGGAIASIATGWSDTFVVCNGDIITDLDLTAMIAAHRQHEAELSISLHEVEEPSPFGVVDLEQTGRIRRFVEKPSREEAPSQLINAGTWIFEPSLLREMDATQFNRVEETLFANLAEAGRGIFGFHRPARWEDIGNAAALLRVNLELAEAAADTSNDSPLWGEPVASDATVSPRAVVDRPCVIGSGCAIEPEARVTESLLWDGVHVEPGAVVARSIIASGVRIGAGAVVEDAVVAHEAIIAPGARVIGESIEPGVTITTAPPPKVRQ